MDIALQAIQSLATHSAENSQHVELPTAQQWAGPQNEASQQDVAAFQQALDSVHQSEHVTQAAQGHAASDSQNQSSIADDVLNKMQSLSSSAAEKGEALERLIVKATDSLNPMDIVQANRMMSEYYLENLMTAKLVGNATKAVERLTSLN